MRKVRRNTELGLIVLVVMIIGASYALASIGQDAVIPPNVLAFLGVVLGLLLVAHIVCRRVAPDADSTLLPLAGLLNGLGFVFIARINEKLAWQQATWTAVGIGMFCLTLIVIRRARSLDGYRWTFALAGIALLMLPLAPGIGTDFNQGARIWVKVGSLSFQPGEAAKICLAIFFASYLVEKRELLALGRRVGPVTVPDLKHLGPVLLAWGASLVVMISQKDLGSSLLFFALFIVMLWVATERFVYVVTGSALFAVGAYLSWRAFDHVQTRVTIWLDPWSDAQDKGFQIVQAAFAMAAGGVGGTGLGLSGRINIPLAESDFIFAVLASELGLVGATVVLITFLLIIGAGLRIAVRADNAFDKLLAVGLTTLIGLQSFIIIAGVTRLLPLTGITLPFVSYGGSSLISNYVLIALLMRISDDNAPVSMEDAKELVTA
jgi:peptidoglycan glycosyltransferase